MKNEMKPKLTKLMQNAQHNTALKQLLIGSASGWVTGFCVVRVGKPVAFIVGSSIILMQAAQTKGIMKQDWNELKAKTDKFLSEKAAGDKPAGPSLVQKAQSYAKENVPFTAGFIGGFLIGMTS